MHVFLTYFGWPYGATWSNVGAMPACGVVAAVAAFVFRDRIGRALSGWWKRHFGHHEEIAELREMAATAHQIMADLFQHQTGVRHPDAPDSGETVSPQ